MLTAGELEARREVIEASGDLSRLRDRLLAHAHLVLERDPRIPSHKGMLTVDGGRCPTDGGLLHFDPWSPAVHRCVRCGAEVTGERHDRRWAWLEHLWLAERIASLAATGIVAGEEALVEWAATRVRDYAERYADYPNADNVLGPSRLFFSTYLESVWLTRYLAGAFFLREAGALDEEALERVNGLVEEAANLIGEFDEGASNRQVWHNAALAAAAVWFEDEDLARRAIEGPRGLVGALADGFGAEGMWYEGENYHLFALQGMLIGAGWARLAGVDFFEEEQSLGRLMAALRAPIHSALPDGTFPARKDARFGVSLAQPMYLDLWENGLAGLLGAGQLEPAAELAGWLRRLYALPAPAAETFDSWLEEAGEPRPERRERRHLSWWMLLTMAPELPEPRESRIESILLAEEGLAILRPAGSYASLDCGGESGGHGHPDRLHLTLHADGVHWLADPGTASYVSPDLFWYRSTLAHNAPRLDGHSQPAGDARCENFEMSARWGWMRGRFAGFTRTVVAGESQLVDLLEFNGEEERVVELALHPLGELTVLSPGTWEAAELEDPFAKAAERFVPAGPGPIRWQATEGGRTLAGLFDPAGDLLRAMAPGRPGEERERPFLLRRQRGRYVRFAMVAGWGSAPVESVNFTPGEITVMKGGSRVAHRLVSEGWEVEDGEGRTLLRGQRRGPLEVTLDVPTPHDHPRRFQPPEAVAEHAPEPPALDGGLDDFPVEPAFHLDHDDQYRRSEEPYPGPDAFSAEAHLAWDERALYLGVRVHKADCCFRAPDAPPLLLDNEPDLIHADGLQLYLAPHGEPMSGWLIAPDPRGDGLTVVPVRGTAAAAGQVTGRWRRVGSGYIVTLAVTPSAWPPAAADQGPRLDLIVNEMRPDRVRRAGQLVWSGGGGWVYLRGDRHDPARLGQVILR